MLKQDGPQAYHGGPFVKLLLAVHYKALIQLNTHLAPAKERHLTSESFMWSDIISPSSSSSSSW